MKRKRHTTGPTIHEVARAANVSAMSVSRTLRDIEGVSPATRKRIIGIARTMGYVADNRARSISQPSSNLIGISVPTLFNDVFADMLSIMRQKLAYAGFETLIDTTDYDSKRERIWIERLLTWRPAALVLTGIHRDPALRDLLKSRDIVTLEVWEHAADPIDLCVGIDHFAAGLAIGQHVAGLGYTRPAFVGDVLGKDPRAEQRLSGLNEAFCEIAPDGIRTMRTAQANAFEAGHLGTLELLQQVAVARPDVIFFYNDHTAFGGMMALQKLGLDVPRDVGVVGFNRLRLTKVLPIELTTVETPRQAMGEMAARTLLSRINGARVEASTKLAFEIVSGETTRVQR